MNPPPLPNPYEAPKTDVTTTPDGSLPLASPWIRLGAVLIDGIVLAPFNWILSKLLFKQPTEEEIRAAIAKTGDAMEAVNSLMPSKGMMLLNSLLGLAILLAVNYTFLKKGQTVGKMLLKLQIQNRNDGSILPLNDLIVKRFLPVQALGLLSVAFLGVSGLFYAVSIIVGLILIADALCIFRPGRNTIHDDIANTKVVKLPA